MTRNTVDGLAGSWALPVLSFDSSGVPSRPSCMLPYMARGTEAKEPIGTAITWRRKAVTSHHETLTKSPADPDGDFGPIYGIASNRFTITCAPQ